MIIDHENGGSWRGIVNMFGNCLWQLPGRFGVARILGPFYSLRCVVFHDVSPAETSFTKGMGVSITPSDFERVLKFLTQHYTPVSLQDVLAASAGKKLPPRPLLVTFDDGYASIKSWALPLCRSYGVPAVIFLNAAFLDNRDLAPDSLVCYAANVFGMELINQAAGLLKRSDIGELNSQDQVFAFLFPAISVRERRDFLTALTQMGGINGPQLARDSGLYLSCDQVREVSASGFEIGNHTYTHVRCRSLTSEEFDEEVERNKTALGRITGTAVRSFSVPYGSSNDLTGELVRSLRGSGHEAIFLSESVANSQYESQFCYDRVSVHNGKDKALFCEIEVMPRLRAMRNRVRRHAVSRERASTHAAGPERVKVESQCPPTA